ncbi:MAG: hypothetical protein BWK80_61195 [Desulfobacteraceae bacterium IS3]|nr:MAG: hypothetical protein BWK80_61195 [Desulfobacteraceae bacterium IS3]
MSEKTAPITKQRHGNKKIKPVNSFKFAANFYIVSLITNEFSKASSAHPIVFVKDNDDLKVFALLGIKKGQNLFVDKDGRWLSHYIPSIIRRYPFLLGINEDTKDLMLCVEEDSEFLSDTEGEPLFDKKGNPGSILDKAKNYLIELQRFSEVTNLFCKELSRLGLLEPLKMQITNAEGVQVKIEGIHAVNEKKLNELPDEEFMTLRNRGALSLIYSHLVSLGQIERLVQMQTERGY